MFLSLDHQQRLCLIALLGTQRGTVSEMRMWGSLMDRFELDQAEKERIEYRTAIGQNGVEQASWNYDKGLPYKEYEVSENEAQRMRRAVEEWPYFMTVTDRKWVFHLLDQMPELSSTAASTVPMPVPTRM
jgi:hypothetical protein